MIYEKGMKIHMMMSHVKVYSLTTYHVLLAKFGEFTIDLHALKLTIGSTTTLVTSLSIPLSQHMDLTFGTNQQARGRSHGVYLIGTPITTQPHLN